jgi:uncharacterized coiled-coil DUF342 family protein
MSDKPKELIAMRAILDGSLAREERIVQNMRAMLKISNLSTKTQDEIVKYIENLHRLLHSAEEGTITLLELLVSNDQTPEF